MKRFWDKVNKTINCWEWQASGVRSGYGKFWNEGANRFAHIFSYELAYGKVPKGLYVCHKCDNPKCVRPDHLFLGTAKDNAVDKTLKGRHPQKNKTHCIRGHEYTAENTYTSNRGRNCRICTNARHRAERVIKKERSI